MKSHQSSAVVLRSEAVFHQPIPDLAGGTIFGDFFEEIVVSVEEEAEARPEIIHIKAATSGPLHIFDAVINRECQLLKRGRAGFADVVARYRDGVEAWCELRSELEGINHQPHRRSGRVD